MYNILCIETSTKSCSVALQLSDGSIMENNEFTPQVHASRLSPMIDVLMKQAKLEYEALDAIACSRGPGSYTGLRIAYATAKGLALPFQIPLVEVQTLQCIASRMKEMNPDLQHSCIPMIYAGRKEFYIYSTLAAHANASQQVQIVGIEPDADFFERVLNKFPDAIFAATNTSVLSASLSVDLQGRLREVQPLARSMMHSAQNAIEQANFASIADCVPFYFKAPNITKSNKTILNI